MESRGDVPRGGLTSDVEQAALLANIAEHLTFWRLNTREGRDEGERRCEECCSLQSEPCSSPA